MARKAKTRARLLPSIDVDEFSRITKVIRKELHEIRDSLKDIREALRPQEKKEETVETEATSE